MKNKTNQFLAAVIMLFIGGCTQMSAQLDGSVPTPAALTPAPAAA